MLTILKQLSNTLAYGKAIDQALKDARASATYQARLGWLHHQHIQTSPESDWENLHYTGRDCQKCITALEKQEGFV